MMNIFKDVINRGKDVALSIAIKKALTSILSKYGEVENFNIFTSSKIAKATIHLKGEETPTDIKIEGYSFVFNDDACGVQFDKVITNKEWFNILAIDFLVGKTLPIQNADACIGLKVFLSESDTTKKGKPDESL